MTLLIIDRLDTVGFVDRGANPESDIVIWKRAISHNHGGDPMEFDRSGLSDEAREYVEGLDVQITAAADEAKLAKAEVDKVATQVATQIADLEAKLVKLAKGDEGNEGDPVLKALDDETRQHVEAAIAKAGKDAEARISKAEEVAKEATEAAAVEKRERLMTKFSKQAGEDMDHLQGDLSSQAVLLYAVHENLSEATVKSFQDMVRAANSQIKKAKDEGFLGAKGKDGEDDSPDSPWNIVLDKAKALTDADPKITKAAAVEIVLKNDPKLAEATRS